MKKLKELKKLKLTETEKRGLFARVQNSIKKLPDSADASFEYPVPSPFYHFVFFPQSAFLKAGVLALLVLSLSGATAYASLDTLPGDLLYGLKINVVERISKMAALTPERRARAETVQIERRIAEFETLADKGILTEEHTEIIEKNINARLENFDRNVENIRQRTGEGQERTREEKELDTKLEKHAEKIEKIRREKSPNKRALEAVLQRVEERRQEREEEQKPEDREGEDSTDERDSENWEEYRDDGALDLELPVELPAI